MKLSKLWFLLALVGSSAVAEMPDISNYRLQESAPIYLDVKIKSVKVTVLKNSMQRLDWTAQITDIWRSDKPLKIGQTISIRHEQMNPNERASGPAPAPKLKVGDEVPAFLKRGANGIFDSAKYGKLFQVTPRPKVK